MKTKTITYKRILNLGNYESKHLEETVELVDGEDADYAASLLMERVEYKIHEDISQRIADEITRLKQQLHYLQKECERAKTSLEKFKPPFEPDIDDIPFDSGEAPKDSSGSPWDS